MAVDANANNKNGDAMSNHNADANRTDMDHADAHHKVASTEPLPTLDASAEEESKTTDGTQEAHTELAAVNAKKTDHAEDPTVSVESGEVKTNASTSRTTAANQNATAATPATHATSATTGTTATTAATSATTGTAATTAATAATSATSATTATYASNQPSAADARRSKNFPASVVKSQLATANATRPNLSVSNLADPSSKTTGATAADAKNNQSGTADAKSNNGDARRSGIPVTHACNKVSTVDA